MIDISDAQKWRASRQLDVSDASDWLSQKRARRFRDGAPNALARWHGVD